jgi:hypothetical protein
VRILILFLAAPALFAQPAQTPTPVFTRENMVPLQGNRAKLLAPGMVVELYGQHLAAEPWCGENATPPAPYPVEVCGVRVMVGASPAGLMYVGPVQINFKIPADAPAEGSAPIQVCVRGVCSAPVVMQFSTHKAFLRLQGTASVHMPVWVAIDEPAPYEVKYPCAGVPWSFDGYQFEVRRNGELLSPAPPPKPLSDLGPGGCWGAAAPSALPLHLLYSFDQPGVYSVRFTAAKRAGPDPAATASQSDWTDITVEPYASAKRDEWLQSMTEKVKSAPPQALIADVIPSLLAWPDDKALTVLLPLLALPGPKAQIANAIYDPTTGAPFPNGSDLMGYAGQFARASLAAFSDDLLRRIIPPDRLLSFCPPDGRCRAAN